MSLLDVLRLRPPGARGSAPVPQPRSATEAPPAPGSGRSREPAGLDIDGDDPVVEALDAIGELLDKLPEADKARAGFDTELAALRARHASVPPARRDAARKAELAAAQALAAKVRKVTDKADQARELEQTRAQVDTALTRVYAMVLSVISDNSLRQDIAVELARLQAAQAKAAKIADPKAALAGWKALLAPVQALEARAGGARDAIAASRDELEPLLASAMAAIAAVPATLAAARMRLEAEGKAIDVERKRLLAAMDPAALVTTLKPRLVKLEALAKGLPAAASRVEAALKRADTALGKLDGDAAAALKERLAALRAERAGDWPAGATAPEMTASFERVTKGADALATEAEGLGPKLKRQKEIAELRKRLDGLKTRLDRAAGPAEAKVLEAMQKRLVDHLAKFTTFEAKADLKSCEILFSNIGATLDTLETLVGLVRAAKQRLQAARNGGIKAALAVKLEPAAVAALRQKAIESRGQDIEAMIDGGNLVAADKAVEDWLLSAKTWGEAPKAYANLRSGKPQKKVMTELIGKPGGGAVFDALIADLPEGKTEAEAHVTTETMQLALEARFGTKVEQFDQRTAGIDEAPDDAAHRAPRTATNPKAPQKGLKDLYKILRMVPVQDVRHTEKIVDYEVDEGGAYYQGGPRRKGERGSDADVIVMYAGRPDQPPSMDLGGTQAPGQTADPDAQPVDTAKVNGYTHTALHEVGHAVDDAKGVMGRHMDEAGWEAWTVEAVAKKVAGFYSYDEAYTLAVLKGESPVPAPRPASVKDDATWESARRDVVHWAAAMGTSADPWNSASNAKNKAIGGRVIHEAYKGRWVSYHLAARSKGIRAYQFRAPGEWFAELYAAFHLGKLKPSHPSIKWLNALKAESEAA